MRRHHTLVLALLVWIATAGIKQSASAQAWANNRFAQNTPTPAARAKVEELPAGKLVPRPMVESSKFRDDVGGGISSGDPGDPSAYGCPEASCDSCDGYPCGEPCSSCGSGSGLWGCGGSGGQWFFTADYLNVGAHFSEALSYVELVTTDNPAADTLIFHQLDFGRESSYRFGGGYRLCCCGEEIRFNFTRFTGSASDSIVGTDRDTGRAVELPFNPNPNDPFLDFTVPQTGTIRASVDVNSYDLEWRKTIPLGGNSRADCCEPCGCGDSCGCNCPAWDITWSGGVRGAQADLDRRYIRTDTQTPDNDTDTTSALQFDGAGPRFGVEGRRYFGRNGWFSVFMKGDISLLFGQLDLRNTNHLVAAGIDQNTAQELHMQQIVPVTEIETGIAANVTCHSTFSAGYMLSAWHDLGFRDEPGLGTQEAGAQIAILYDDANIMSFDGIFARWEWAY